MLTLVYVYVFSVFIIPRVIGDHWSVRITSISRSLENLVNNVYIVLLLTGIFRLNRVIPLSVVDFLNTVIHYPVDMRVKRLVSARSSLPPAFQCKKVQVARNQNTNH